MKKNNLLSTILALAICLYMSLSPLTAFAAVTVVITNPPTNVVRVNDDFKLTAQATVGVSYSYTWEYSTDNGKSWANTNAPSLAAFTVPTTTIGSTYYRVTASNSNTTVTSAVVQVTVREKLTSALVVNTGLNGEPPILSLPVKSTGVAKVLEAASITVLEDTQVTVTAGAPHSGYQFSKWVSVPADFTGITKATGTAQTFSMPGYPLTLTATYAVPHILTVTNDANGQSAIANKSGSLVPESTVSITAGAPNEGYEFAGWVAEPATYSDFFQATQSETQQIITPAYDLKLTATYKQKIESYKVTMIDGMLLNNNTDGIFNAGAPVTIKAEATRGGKNFTNWSTSPTVSLKSTTELETSFTMPASSITVTANYTEPEPAKYAAKVTGGTLENGTESGQYKAKDVVILKLDKTKTPTGEMFGSWLVKDSQANILPTTQIGEDYTFEMPSNNVTITPQYSNIPATALSITPAVPNVAPGKTQTFIATVTNNNGKGTPKQTVTWSIDNDALLKGNKIDATGKLTIAANAATNSKIVVTATSTVTPTITTNTAVTVTNTTPTVTSVTITPNTTASLLLDRPGNKTFTATVAGTNNPAQTVDWSISGQNSKHTTIDSKGYLTIGYNETSYNITVKATSTVNKDKYATVTVKIDIANDLEPPTFYTNLSATKSVYNGNDITLSVAAEIYGSGTISYQWYKNSRKLTGEEERTLKITNAGSSDKGEYYVIATRTYNRQQASTKSVVCTLSVSGTSSSGNSGGSSGSGSYSDDGGDYGGSKTKATTIDLNGKNFSPDNINTKKDSYEITLSGSKKSYITIPTTTLNDIKSNNRNMVLSLNGNFASYELPVNIASLSTELTDILDENGLRENQVDIKITMSDVSSNRDLTNTLDKRFPNAKILGSAVDFEIAVIKHSTGKEIGSLSRFSNPVQRYIPVSKSELPNYIGVFRFNTNTNTMDFVPHKTVKIDGINNLSINTNTNSIYVAVENHVNFSDVPSGIWYTNGIKIASSKGIVVGMGSNMYYPDSTVTRAEFVQMIVKVLALPEAKAKTAAYNDMNKNDWYYDPILRAKSAGILDKFDSGSFSPNIPINREEMAVVLAGAIRYENANISTTNNSLSAAFKDYGKISSNNTSDVSFIYNAKIMQGVGGNYFDPKGLSTRAQAAIVLVNMVQKLNII